MNKWFRRKISFKLATLTIVMAVTFMAYLTIPLKVTVDGVNYISSAKALFTQDISSKYVWYREPGYPLFIKLIHGLSEDGSLLVVCQGLCLGIAAAICFFLVRRSQGQVHTNPFEILIAIVLVLNPAFLIYSGLVLQQALFSLILSCFALLTFFSVTTDISKKLRVLLILLTTIMLYITAITTSIGWIYLGLFPAVSVFVILSVKKLKSFPIFRITRHGILLWIVTSLIISAALILTTYKIGISTYGTWERYKQSNIPASFSMPNVIAPLETVPYIPTPVEISSRMLSIMSIGLQEHYTYENKLFLDQQMRRIWPLSEWDTAYISHPYSDYASGYISLTNPNKLAHDIYSYFSKYAINAYRVTFLASLITFIWSMIKKQWLVVGVQLFPLYFIFVYAASNSPIDRYGIPAFPFAAASTGLLITLIFQLKKRKGQRTS